MEFGTWISNERDKRGLNAQFLARQVGLSTSKLSLIENGHSEPTLAIAVAIAGALDVDREQVLQVLLEDDYSAPKEVNSPTDRSVLTPLLAKEFINSFQVDTESSIALLTKLWQTADQKWYLAERTGYFAVYEPLESAEALIATHIRNRKFVQVTTKDEKRLLPPLELEFQKLFRIHLAGGILTFREIGRYLQELRRERKYTLADIAKAHHRSLAVLSRFEAAGESKIRLNDILFFDKNAECDGELFRMYWNAMIFPLNAFQNNLAPNEIDITEVGNLFIHLCRLIQQNRSSDNSYLAELEHDVYAIRNVTVGIKKIAYIPTFTDEEWKRIQSALVSQGISLTAEQLKFLDCIFYKLMSGCNWDKLPTQYEPISDAKDQFKTWIETGTWRQIWNACRQNWSFAHQESWINAFRKGHFVPTL